ncbi:MAG: hypothetical protein IK102_10900 [Treponema sp.]|nr:hypothetical protein [Treponema sp.]
MKRHYVLSVILFIFLTIPLFAGEGIELNNLNSTWSRVLPGKPMCEPQMTSKGFAVITDAKNLMSFTSSGSLIYEKPLTRSTNAFFGVLNHDFVAVITNNSKKITMLNPDGKELWSINEDFKITDKPFSGRDGRFFVRGQDTLCCYGITGIRKWKIQTPVQSKTAVQELTDGSLVVFLQQLDQGKTQALRITPFGEIVEQITFAGEVIHALTTPQGILLVFTDGTSGLFELAQNKSVHKWLFKKELGKKTNSDFFILSQDKTEVIYVNIKTGNVEIDYINLEDGSVKNSFTIDEGITPTYGWYNSSGVFIADSKKACFYNNMGRYIWSGKMPDKKSPVKVSWTSFTTDNCFLLFCSDWSIYAFQTAIAPAKTDSSKKNSNTRPSYKEHYVIDTTLLELSFPMPLDKELLKSERNQILLNGNYGTTERQYASELLSVCTAYKNVISSMDFGSRKEKSIFQTDAAGLEKLLSQFGLFCTDTFCEYTAYFLRHEADRTVLHTLLYGISINGYDPDGKIMDSLEYLARNISPKDENLLKDLCNAVLSVCNTMGTQAVDPQGRDTLSVLMYPKYTSIIRDYARNTMKKLVGK